jgi:ABC-type nickel/cobalt efflux system permease component RcnA
MAAATVLVTCGTPGASAHDIPNQRVDRSIQVSVHPRRLEVDYEVSLTELTLTQDLRALEGNLPGADREEWLARYAIVTGPLNAKGILISIDGRPAALQAQGYDLVVEEHPRYTFHFAVAISGPGRVSVHDTNYVSSEGTSRLAVRGLGGVVVSGDDLPADVNQIPIRSVWQLSDKEEQRTKKVVFEVHMPASNRAEAQEARGPDVAASGTLSKPTQRSESSNPPRFDRISRLLGENTRWPWLTLAAMALALGAVHALQPGHGKTMLTAVALGPGARFYQPPLLGLATTLAHTGSVLVIAAVLWYTGATRVEAFHSGLTQAAGFGIAAAGFWRFGRQLGGHNQHAHNAAMSAAAGNLAVLGLGLAGGLVPCWDAVGLLVLAAALGRLAEGVGLVLIFSAGMAATLVTLGFLTWKVKASTIGVDVDPRWQRGLGLSSSIILSAIGLLLFFQI